jgi:hypothetical protein
MELREAVSSMTFYSTPEAILLFTAHETSLQHDKLRRRHEPIFQGKENVRFCSICFDTDAVGVYPSVEQQRVSA